MPPPTAATVPSSEDNSDVDEELRAMEQHKIIAPKPQRPAKTGSQNADAARPVAAHAAATSTGMQAQTTPAPAAGTTRPASASGDAPRKTTTPPARPATAHGVYRPIRISAGSSARPETPASGRIVSTAAAIKKKTPTTTTQSTTPSSEAKEDHINVVEKQATLRVAAQKELLEHLTPRIPATYAEKIKRFTTHKLAAKIETRYPRMIKQKSLESIRRNAPSTSGMQDTQHISFDRSSRTVSPSNLKPISPTPFPSRHSRSQDNLATTGQDTQPQRETRKRQFEADDTTATQPAKMQPPALITTPPTPPILQQPPQVATQAEETPAKSAAKKPRPLGERRRVKDGKIKQLNRAKPPGRS
ncbi:hypothetical protein ACJJTC_002078 [Scirpophaga incertulas]